MRCCPLGALLRNILGFLIYACVAVDMIFRTHGAVTYLVVTPCFAVLRGRVFFACGLVFLLLLRFLLSLFFFFDAQKPPSSYGTHVARWFGARNVLFFVVAARLFLVFASFLLLCCWSAHKSLAPRTRTLLGVLGQATLNFFAVATLLFVFFCESPKFCDLAKQRRKIFGGVSEVIKEDFSLYFFWRCVVFVVFYFSSASIARRF